MLDYQFDSQAFMYSFYILFFAFDYIKRIIFGHFVKTADFEGSKPHISCLALKAASQNAVIILFFVYRFCFSTFRN